MNEVAEAPTLADSVGATVKAGWYSGLFPDMPADEYHRAEALSASGAKKLLQSPLHYKLMRDQPPQPTDAMQFGSAVHYGVLQPDLLGRRVIFVPADAPPKPTSRQINAKKPSADTLEALNFWRRFDESAHGLIVLASRDFDRARRCIDAVRAHPAASELLTGATVEQSLFWNDARYGVPCKARWDAFNHGGVIDLKTTADASPEAFARDVARYLYHVQAAHYMSGGEHVRNETPRFYVIVAVESEPPHAVACYSLPGEAVQAGGHLMTIATERYAAALAAGRWPGYDEQIVPLRMPRWALRFDA